jgi:hypothetical protein
MMSDDLLDDLLQPPLREAPANVRGVLRDRTARVVRWRRYRRRALQLIIAAAAQGAIAAAMVAWLVGAGALTWKEQTPLPPEPPVVQNQEKPRNDPAPLPDSELTAIALEWKAFDATPEEQATLYFQAAQRYFDNHQDFASALRCYRQAFVAGPKDWLTVSPSDNWLVMAIKLDCRKEN